MELHVRFGNFIENSHVIIGCAAVALALETYAVQDLQVNLFLLILLFFGSIIFYGLHRLLQVKKYGALDSARIEALKQYRPIIIRSTLVSVLGVVFLFFSNKWQDGIIEFMKWEILIPTLLFGIIYLLPLGRSIFRLRDIPYLKIIVLSLGWAYATVFLPLIFEDIVWSNHVVLQFVERAFFIFTITLPFEIRDVKDDSACNVKTLATRYGVEKVIFLMRLLSVTGILFHVLSGRMSGENEHFVLALFYAFVLISSTWIKRLRFPFLYTIIWDSTMVYRGLFVVYFLAMS